SASDVSLKTTASIRSSLNEIHSEIRLINRKSHNGIQDETRCLDSSALTSPRDSEAFKLLFACFQAILLVSKSVFTASRGVIFMDYIAYIVILPCMQVLHYTELIDF